MSNRNREMRSFLVRRATAWVLVLPLVFCAAIAQAETKLVNSEVSVSGTGAFISDDDSQFRQRHGIPPGFTGGIENLLMEWTWGNGGTATLDGRVMVDSGDYRARLKIDQAGKGYISAGYRQFRTWYDGTGGYFPPTNTIIDYFDQDLPLDRGEGWLEAGLRMPEIPEVTVRYSHLSRDGKKNSLEWGDTQLAVGTTRTIVPSLWKIDEDRDILNLDVKHHMLRSNLGAGFVYEGSALDNSMNARRRPNEPQDRYFSEANRVDSDILGGHAFTSTPFLDNKLVFSTSYGYTSLESDLGGSRVYGNRFNAPFDPAYTNRQALDTGFINLNGTTELRQHVGTFTLQTHITKQIQATAGARFAQEDTDGHSDFIATEVGFPPALATSQDPFAAKSNSDLSSYTGSLELRYTGLKNWVWTVFGEWDTRDGSIDEIERDVAAPAVTLQRSTDIERFGQKYGVGAVWYPLKRVNVSSRYTYRIHDYDYDHKVDSTDNTSTDRYPAYITSQKIDANAVDVRLTYRVLDNVRLTARYDGTFQTYDQQCSGLATKNSADVDTNAFGGSATWNPTAASYIQSEFNYVLSKTTTPVDELTGPASGIAAHDFENDYWTATLTGGLAVTENMDLRGQYFFYRTDNYDKGLSATTLPYGADATEHGVSLQFGYRTSEHLRWHAGYAFFTNDEDTAGGANDYDASVITGGVDMKF